MASRAKKDASSAIKMLADYLRHDPGAAQHVDNISRYVGELRQSRTSLNTEIAALKSRLELSIGEREMAESQISPLKTQLDREKGLHQQTRSQLAASERRVANLEKELAPDDVILVDDKLSDSYKFNEVMRELQLRMKKPPQPLRHVVKDDKAFLFRLEDVMTTSDRDQFTTLGMFVVIAASLGFSPAFRISRKFIRWTEDRHKKRAVRWMRRWIGASKEDDRRHYQNVEMHMKHTGQPPGGW